MKRHLVLCLLGLNLVACKETGPSPENSPAGTNFDQEFTLYPQQQAKLPGTSTPELTVTLTDLDFSYCPPAAACLVGNSVSPKLSITDAQGHTQLLALPLMRSRISEPAWIDTTNISANGRRYLVYYHKWNIPTLPMGQIPQKTDISVTLRVKK